MRASVEPVRVRKRPGFWLRLLSWVWPISVCSVAGMAGTRLKVVAWRGKYLLDTGKVNYSFGSLHQVMLGSIKAMVEMGVKTDRVLMLGYGGGSAAEIIHQEYSRTSEIVGVELDAAVLDLAKRYFYTQGVRLLQEDAVEYVRKASKQAWQYDLVICDLFVDGNVAEGVVAKSFVGGLSSIAENGGGVIVNTMMKSEQAKALELLLREQFSEVIPWDGVKGNAVFLCKMGGNA
jgi:spermidine synthase